jgi:hypothetical protein
MKRKVHLDGLILWLGVALILVGCGGEKPPVEIPHTNIVVNLTSTDDARRPYLRVDVTFLAPATTNKDTIAKLAGAVAKDAITKALAGLDPVEVLLQDREQAQKDAAQLIIKAISTAEIDAPDLRVMFPAFVVQG